MSARLELDNEQKAAVKMATTNNFSIITGGPGSGKSTVIRTIVETLEKNYERVALCAPTGKAAKRMQELSDRPAKTIHRLLHASYGSWGYNIHNPLRAFRCVIVDESSMIDIDLFYHLIQALPAATRLVLVGDVDQLPPVGPGTPFRDLIASKKVPLTRLVTNHRTGAGSSIASNANAINHGGFRLTVDNDFQIMMLPTHIHLREKLSSVLQTLKKEGYDLIRDVQVLSPQKNTQVGVEALNQLLRHHLNPNAKGWGKFAVGDKVMQNNNDYSLNIFNGYLGQIVGSSSYYWEINFFDVDSTTAIKYPKNKEHQLIPAYACTIHKAQGSEFKAGIMIVSSSHTWMLTRNLFYTGITRFREKCIVMGDEVALKRAISNTRESERYSKFLDRVLGEL